MSQPSSTVRSSLPHMPSISLMLTRPKPASAPISKSLFSSLVALAATSESKSTSVPSDL
ncbi:MAG: hypothetical protein Q9212_006587, partial [Teloschistes hypoglaucus]